MPAPQTYKNHTRYDPLFHFIILPLLLINFGFWIQVTIHYWPRHHAGHLWGIVMSIVLFLIAGMARSSAIRAQDRVIRLEELHRYAALLSPADATAAARLTLRQIIALRFASDSELPALIQRSLSENLTSKQIKQSITTWRPDYHRV